MPKSFSGAPLTQKYQKLNLLGEGSSLSMDLRKLFPRVVLATLAFSILSVSAFAQTRPRVANGGEANEVSCSPDDLAVLASAEPAPKPRWEAKPKPIIDLAPAPSSSGSGFIKFEPLLKIGRASCRE